MNSEPTRRYVVSVQPGTWFGYWAVFQCDYPDDEFIGWEERPGTWRWTRKSAERWGRRRARSNDRFKARQKATVEVPLS